jgi:pimeloyl-ACP methyl ester carboxylesterase
MFGCLSRTPSSPGRTRPVPAGDAVLGRLTTRRTTRASALFTERMLYADPALATKERIDHALAIARQPDAGTAMLEISRELVTARGIKPRWRAELIAAAATPPHVDRLGDRDRILPPHHLDTARRLIPHAQTHLFTAIDHTSQIECPDEFAARPRFCRRRRGPCSPPHVTHSAEFWPTDTYNYTVRFTSQI